MLHMQMGWHRLLVVIALVIACQPAAECFSAITPGKLDTAALTADADLIVVGRVSGLDGRWQNWGAQEVSPTFIGRFALSVDRVLKGKLTAATRQVEIDAIPNRPVGSLQNAEYGMFFLKKDAEGLLEPVDAYNPFRIASPSPRSNKSADALSAVALELVHVLATPAATLIDPKIGLHPEGGKQELIEAEWYYGDVQEAFSSIPSRIAHQPLTALAANAGPKTRLWAIACMLATGDSNLLASVVSQLVDPPHEFEFAASAIGTVLDTGRKTTIDTGTLIVLHSSTNAIIRAASASALSRLD